MSKDSVEPRAGVRPGDWIAVHQIGGGAPRRGTIVEVLGRPGHEHYRVRWDAQHESIHFPTEGTAIERRARRAAAASSGAICGTFRVRARAGATRSRVMDVRYVCGDCGIKWFVRAGNDQLAPVPACGACGGVLRPFTAGCATPAGSPDDEPAREPDD